MSNIKSYSVTVYGVFSKEVNVYAESEDEAYDLVQQICDKTDLIDFSPSDLVDIHADDIMELPEICPCAVCPDCEVSNK